MKLTLRAFIAQSTIPAKLIRAVEIFKEIAADVSKHGANAGFARFIWYYDTVKFTQRNFKEILQQLRQEAKNYGHKSVAEMISNFSYINLSSFEIEYTLIYKNSDHKGELFNTLAWYCLEEVAYEFVNFVEGE